MLKLIDYELIQRLHQRGYSFRRIAKELGHCRKTVTSVIRNWDGTPPRYTLMEPRPKRVVTAELEAWVEEILRADAASRSKQRHTAKKIYERIPARFPGLSIGESTVRELVSTIRKRLKPSPTSVPLAFAPGEEAQVDWWEAEVRIAGKAVVLQFLLVVLCYSRRAFAMAFESANQEAFCEGQARAFDFFGGIPERQAYDNLNLAVKKVLVGGARQENEYFKSFRLHHGFEARYCTVGLAGAPEKGRVERQVPFLRRNILVPVPDVDSVAALNQHLLEGCDSLAHRPHPDNPERTVAELFGEERLALQRLPGHRFRACKVRTSKADGHARIQFQKNRYSLPHAYGRRSVETHIYFDRLEFYDGQKLVASWPRCYETGKTFYDYQHYLALLKQKPGASLNGAPFLSLPRPLLDYREELLARFDRRTAARAFAQVALKLLEHDEEQVVAAVELTRCFGSLDPAGVLSTLEQLARPQVRRVATLDLSERPRLALPVPKTSIAKYDELIGGAA